jgi:hypothetical protein
MLQSPSPNPRFGRELPIFGCNGLIETRNINRYSSLLFTRFARSWASFGTKAGYVMGSTAIGGKSLSGVFVNWDSTAPMLAAVIFLWCAAR